MVEPYNDPSAHGRGPDWKGEPFVSAEALGDVMAKLNQNGMFLKVHASANGAHRLVLDAAEIARSQTGGQGPRNEAAHSILVHREDRERYARLNLAAKLSPSMWYPSEMHMGGIRDTGMERTHQQFPTRALIDAGAMVTAGSDWPVGEPNPWSSIEALITRQDPYRSTDHLGMPYLGKQMRGLYAEDVKIVTAGTPPVEGVEAAMGFFADIFASPADQLPMNIQKVEVEGNMAVETGDYILALRDRSPMDMGNYLVNWRKDTDGTWRITNDVIVNTVPSS